MLSSAQTLAPKPALPPAAPPAPQSPGANAAGPSFAQFLNGPGSPPEPAPKASEPDAAARRNAQAAPKPASAAPARPPQAQAEAKAAAAGKAAKTDDAEKAGKADGTAAAAQSEDDDTPETPELKEFAQLIGLVQPPPEPPVGRTAASQAGHAAADADEVAPGRTTARTAKAGTGRADPKTDTATAQAGADPRTDPLAARAGSEPLQAGAQAAAQKPTDTPAAMPNFAATLAQAMPQPGMRADGTPATGQARLQAPLHASAFAPELGARVSLLAVDGVQQAQLQLNPADMGPVSVQIVVDGNQAQVSFHAAQAETRRVLEQSLPDLAAALQGQGLTLSGGGVFQQAQRDADHGQQQAGTDGAERGSPAGGDRTGGTAAATAAPARRSTGLLDTFA